jgi:hypothetical protein
MPRLRFLLCLCALVLLVGTQYAAAQGPGPQFIPDTGTIGSCSFVTGDFDFDCIPLYLAYLIRLAFSLAGGFAVFEIVKGGYEYAISGIPDTIDKETGKKRIKNAIIGLIVVILAYLIVDMILSVVFA